MKASVHVATSTALAGALYWRTNSCALAGACLVSGVLWDLDHVADFLVFSGEKFTIDNFFSWCNDNRWQRVTLLLHSYELYALLAVWTLFYGGPAAYGVLLGAGLHLLLDQLGNRRPLPGLEFSPYFYFLYFRCTADFRKERMLFSRTQTKAGQIKLKDAAGQGVPAKGDL